ncbi:hypothetical protein C5167_001624 [Papaver somniferum]|uniref:Uncharacterized protein n=1 Tax=Papaver somniferum TaxID=3469 RepID=A0A4Y7KYX2_PAPSO|nr:hypothetical protein C5167_001624 [Papaver somniferum]
MLLNSEKQIQNKQRGIEVVLIKVGLGLSRINSSEKMIMVSEAIVSSNTSLITVTTESEQAQQTPGPY